MSEDKAKALNPDIQKICAMFHRGWVNKDEIGVLEQNLEAYKEIEHYLNHMGYELINPPNCPWYITRLKKEFDVDGLENFRKRYGFEKRHLALIIILYCKLIMPKRLNHVEPDVPLSVTLEELVYNYGDKFKTRKTNPTNRIESTLSALVRYYFLAKEKGKYYPGPAMYMLHNGLMFDISKAIISQLAESFRLLDTDLKLNEVVRDDEAGVRESEAVI